jgi:hypothetical protein
MSDTSPPAHAPSSIALFRYVTISQVHALLLAGTTASRAVHEVAASRGHLRAIDRLSLKSLMRAGKAGAQVVSSGEVLAAKEQLWL